MLCQAVPSAAAAEQQKPEMLLALPGSGLHSRSRWMGKRWGTVRRAPLGIRKLMTIFKNPHFHPVPPSCPGSSRMATIGNCC